MVKEIENELNSLLQLVEKLKDESKSNTSESDSFSVSNVKSVIEDCANDAENLFDFRKKLISKLQTGSHYYDILIGRLEVDNKADELLQYVDRLDMENTLNPGAYAINLDSDDVSELKDIIKQCAYDSASTSDFRRLLLSRLPKDAYIFSKLIEKFDGKKSSLSEDMRDIATHFTVNDKPTDLDHAAVFLEQLNHRISLFTFVSRIINIHAEDRFLPVLKDAVSKMGKRSSKRESYETIIIHYEGTGSFDDDEDNIFNIISLYGLTKHKDLWKEIQSSLSQDRHMERIGRELILKLSLLLDFSVEETELVLCRGAMMDTFYSKDETDMIYLYCIENKLDYDIVKSMQKTFATELANIMDEEESQSEGKYTTDLYDYLTEQTSMEPEDYVKVLAIELAPFKRKDASNNSYRKMVFRKYYDEISSSYKEGSDATEVLTPTYWFDKCDAHSMDNFGIAALSSTRAKEIYEGTKLVTRYDLMKIIFIYVCNSGGYFNEFEDICETRLEECGFNHFNLINTFDMLLYLTFKAFEDKIDSECLDEFDYYKELMNRLYDAKKR